MPHQVEVPLSSSIPNIMSSQDEIEQNRSLVEEYNEDEHHQLMEQQSAEAWLTRKSNATSIVASTAALYLTSREENDNDEENRPIIQAQTRGSSFRGRLRKSFSAHSPNTSQEEVEPPLETSDSSGSSERNMTTAQKDEPTSFEDDASSSASSVLYHEPSQDSSNRDPPPKESPRNMILPAILGFGQRLRSGNSSQKQQAPKKFNIVRLHIYDLMASETVMQLPWGCHFPIGKCLSTVNDGLHALGTGAYHCGVEVNGIEYAFGANEMEGLSGVFTCIPKHSPGYEYRTTLDFGRRETTKRTWIKVPKVELVEVPFVENATAPPTVEVNASTVYRDYETFLHGHAVMREMAREYMGCGYDLLKRNCCTFARDACLRLGVLKSEIPTWFLNLAETGAVTKDMAANFRKPLTQILSCNEARQQAQQSEVVPCTVDRGFEVICQEKHNEATTEMEIVKVVESMEYNQANRQGLSVRRTLSGPY